MQIDEHDLKNINELATALEEIDANQNKVYIDEFNVYRELFLESTINNKDERDIRLLSTRFIRRFNPYEPIEVYDRSGKLIFKVPRLFVPLKSVNTKFIKAVDKFRQDGPSEIPRYSSEATQGLLEAIIGSQKDVSDEGFESYGEYILSLQREYNADIERFNKIKAGVDVEESSEQQSGDNKDLSKFMSWE